MTNWTSKDTVNRMRRKDMKIFQITYMIKGMSQKHKKYPN